MLNHYFRPRVLEVEIGDLARMGLTVVVLFTIYLFRTVIFVEMPPA